MARRVHAPLAAIVPDVATGLRAAAATLVPFYLAASLERPELAWTALGGWLGTLADPGGSRGSRARQFVAFTVAGAACVAGAGLAGRDARLGALALAAVAFVGSLLRALDAAGASLGTLLTIVTAVGLSRPGGHPGRDALYFAVGATWATLLSTVVWPVWTHLPVRRALAAVFHEMAAYAAAVDECADRGAGADDAQWAALAGQHRRRIRDAIEAARAMATAVRARRPGEGRVGSNLRVLLGLAEAQFALLVALVESLAAEPAGAPARRLREALRAAGRRYEDVRSELLVAAIGPARASGPVEGAAAASSPDGVVPSSRPGDALAERLLRTSALSLAVAGDLDAPTESVEGGPAPEHGPGRSPLEAARVLAAALAPRSAILRHALRVAGAAAAAFAAGRLLSPAHTHWVTITAVSILQPYPGASLTRAVERIVGTLLGCLVAVGLTVFVRAPALLAAAMVPLSVAAVATKPRSYRLFTFFLTPVFVLLAERYPGDWWTAATRVGDTLAGGVVALVAAFVTFPAWEHRRLPETLGATFKAVGRYADAVLGSLAESGARRDEALVVAARRDAGVALGAAETALEHALAEPVRDERSTADAMQLVTFARRLTGALTALAAHALEDERASDEARPAGQRLPAAARGAAGDVARAALAYVTDVLRDAEAFARGEAVSGRPHAPPDLPPDLGAHARGLVERVINLTALTAGLLNPPPAGPRPPAGQAPA